MEPWYWLHWILGCFVCAVLLLLLLLILTRLYIKCSLGMCTSQRRLDGKVVIITGANSGIGKAAARELALRGAKVILACRNVRKGENAVLCIRNEIGDCHAIVKHLDLCSLASIRSFADEVLREESRLDVLVNNAGVAGGRHMHLTEDHFEEVYQANYLGPVYLTELLLPLLKKSSPSRIVNTGSSAYRLGRVNAQTLSTDVRTRNKPSVLQYSDSKLAMLIWTRAMAEELKASGVTINVLHPGVVSTPIIAKESSNLSNLMLKFNIFAFGRSPEQGAQTIIHLCLSEEADGVSGMYWEECRIARMSRMQSSEADRDLLIATRAVLGLA